MNEDGLRNNSLHSKIDRHIQRIDLRLIENVVNLEEGLFEERKRVYYFFGSISKIKNINDLTFN